MSTLKRKETVRYREPFTVYPRRMKSGRIVWYYQVYGENGKRTTALSTGQTTKSAAREVCRNLQKEDKLIPARAGRMTFKAYSMNWWVWEKCAYIKYRRTRQEITKNYADRSLSILNQHILPFFESIRMEDIRSIEIENWLITLTDKGLSNESVNLYFQRFRVMIREAVRRDILKEDITVKVQLLKSDSKTRGIVPLNVFKILFEEESLLRLWKKEKVYLINLLAACTGMRAGELRGLQVRDIEKGYISITKQYQKNYGLVKTKTKENREIPVPQTLLNKLIDLTDGQDKSFIFESERAPGVPISIVTLNRTLRQALIRAGMDESDIIKINITFHSWRHFFNTVMRSNGLSDSKLQKMTGHKSIAMTDHYTHYDLEDIKEVSAIQAKILPFSNAG
jgi:integrase